MSNYELLRDTEKKIRVIPYGVGDVLLYQTPHYNKRNYILYGVRLSPTKNIEGLIKAFEILIDKHALELT